MVQDQMARNFPTVDGHRVHTSSHRLGCLAVGKYETLCVLTIAAFLLALPMLRYGPMAVGHDTEEHMNYSRHFAEQFWDGELFPHWLLNMNHGLGSPSFFVFPPLPSYVYSFLVPASKAFLLDAFSTMAFLALFLSGISAFLWIRTIASQRVALATAVLYLLMPYHLAIDFYRRTAIPECWALTWMPLVLYFTMQVINGKRGAVVGLAVAYDLLILSHLVTVSMFSAIPLLLAAILSAPGRRLWSVIRVVAGLLLGTGLSCFYFLPALYHSKYFPVPRQGIALKANLLQLWMVRYGIFRDRTDFISGVCLTVLAMIVFLVFCGAVAYSRSSSDQKKQIVLWSSICVIPVLLMFHFSITVWQKLPLVLDAVQYPWRLNMILCIAALPITAIFLSQMSWPLSFPQASSLVFLLLLFATWLVSYGIVLGDYSKRFFPSDPVSESDGWFPSWKAPGMDSRSAFEASRKPRVRFVSSDGTAKVLAWKPRYLEFETETEAGGCAIVNQFYYPEWKANVVGQGRLLEIETAMPQGLLEIQVPPGRQIIRMEIPVGLAERAGRWLSGLCVLFCIVLGLKAAQKPWKIVCGSFGRDGLIDPKKKCARE
jgi:hypothetical protein